MKSKYLFTIVACATLFLILSSCASSFHKVKHRGIPKIRFHQQSSEELISNNADILNEETPEKENMKESDLYIKESQDLDKFDDSSIRESPNKQAESRHCTDKNLLDENVQEVQIKLGESVNQDSQQSNKLLFTSLAIISVGIAVSLIGGSNVFVITAGILLIVIGLILSVAYFLSIDKKDKKLQKKKRTNEPNKIATALIILGFFYLVVSILMVALTAYEGVVLLPLVALLWSVMMIVMGFLRRRQEISRKQKRRLKILLVLSILFLSLINLASFALVAV